LANDQEQYHKLQCSESGGEGRLHTQTALRLRSLIYPPSR